MSITRILIGLLVAGLILAGELLAYRHFGFEAKWVPIVLFAILALAAGSLMHFQAWKALGPYWERPCTGIRWRRRFPNSPKAEIREFLDLFIDAFAFGRRRRCCFVPEDRVMDVYRALYPPGSLADNLELESLCRKLKERYGIDFAPSWREDITLGEIYEKTHKPA